jgi:hypothetical protein
MSFAKRLEAAAREGRISKEQADDIQNWQGEALARLGGQCATAGN